MSRGSAASAADPYEILGLISHEATKEQISKAARKLGLKYHPDKNPSKDAQEMFLSVQKAKELLLDETRRKEFDDKFNAERKRKAYDEERAQSMNKKRKDFKADLEARVSNAMHANNVQLHQETSSQQLQQQQQQQYVNQREEVERLRRDGRLRAEQQGRQQQQQQATTFATATSSENVEVKVKWRRMGVSQSEDSLYTLLSPYGSISQVSFIGTKGTSAVVTFDTNAAAAAAVAGMANNDEFRVTLIENKEIKKNTIFTHNFQTASNATTSSSDSYAHMSNAAIMKSMTSVQKGSSTQAHTELLWDVKRAVDRHGLEARLIRQEQGLQGIEHIADGARSVADEILAPTTVRQPAISHISDIELAVKEKRVLDALVNV
jgi:curved DNA-binding protein CbpA